MLTYADVCSRIGASPDVGFGEDALFELYAQPGNDVRGDYFRLFGAGEGARYSISFLYWYRSTNTDAQGALVGLLPSLALKGWVFIFFFRRATSGAAASGASASWALKGWVFGRATAAQGGGGYFLGPLGTQFTRFTGTKVQILTQTALPVADTPETATALLVAFLRAAAADHMLQVLNSLALLELPAQKYKY